MRIGLLTATLVTSCLALLNTPAHAGVFYLEVGGGASTFLSANPFFGATASPLSGIGVGANFGLYFDFGNGASPIGLQLGVENRISSASDPITGLQLATVASYPVLRIQVTKMFLGVGVSPYLWQRVGSVAGLDGLSPPATAPLCYLGEIGFLSALTPKFSMGVTTTAQFVSTNGVLSPSPALDAAVLLRFYFAATGPDEAASSNEFKGWRYPFGMIR